MCPVRVRTVLDKEFTGTPSTASSSLLLLSSLSLEVSSVARKNYTKTLTVLSTEAELASLLAIKRSWWNLSIIIKVNERRARALLEFTEY